MTSEIIAELDLLVTHLKHNKDIIGDDFCKEVMKSGKKFLKELSESVRENILHNLHEDKPSKERVNAIITALPSTLSVKDEEGRIPIQIACWDDDSVKYVGLLAREGVKYNVGGEGKRGGLLLEDPIFDNHNILQLLSALGGLYNPLKWDALYRDVLKDLWESGLLTAADVREFKLLFYSCINKCQMRFEYLSDMCPEELKLIYDDGGTTPIFHEIIKERKAKHESMQLFLRTALKHFPNELGLLFQQDSDDRTSLEVAVSSYGTEKTFKIIRQFIPQDTKIPILHHVVKYAPQYIDDFVFHYPHAMYLKDEQANNRTYFQARIASGNTTFANSAVFLVSMSPDQIETVDPVTDLYPFMVAASGDNGDLDTAYYLLRREPKLVYEAPKYCHRRGGRIRASGGHQRGAKGRDRNGANQDEIV